MSPLPTIDAPLHHEQGDDDEERRDDEGGWSSEPRRVAPSRKREPPVQRDGHGRRRRDAVYRDDPHPSASPSARGRRQRARPPGAGGSTTPAGTPREGGPDTVRLDEGLGRVHFVRRGHPFRDVLVHVASGETEPLQGQAEAVGIHEEAEGGQPGGEKQREEGLGGADRPARAGKSRLSASATT